MNIRKVRRAIKLAAREHGISEKQLVAEIEDIICSVVEKAKQENDQQTLSKWKKIPSRGELPTAYELIGYLGEQLKEQLGSD